jgi:hypothetical protein
LKFVVASKASCPSFIVERIPTAFNGLPTVSPISTAGSPAIELKVTELNPSDAENQLPQPKGKGEIVVK